MSNSTRGCRLSAKAPHVIGVRGGTHGLTTGAIDPAIAHGKTRKTGKKKPRHHTVERTRAQRMRGK